MSTTASQNKSATAATTRRLSMRPLATLLLILISTHCVTNAQDRAYPRELRGYKVERRVIQLKKPTKQAKPAIATGERPRQVNKPESEPGPTANSTATTEPTSEESADELIKFGPPRVARVTPLGISLEIPIVVAAVQQKGRIDFLTFEDMVFNDTPVEIAEYHRAFDLPNQDPLTLREPLSFYIYLPRAVLAGIDEWINSKQTWPVTGRVYVFGKFKKGWFSFKRCIPVELKLTMRNPLKER